MGRSNKDFLIELFLIYSFPDCPADFVKFLIMPDYKKCFHFTSHRPTYNGALTYCQGKGAVIAEIHSQEENDWVQANNHELDWIGNSNKNFFHLICILKRFKINCR